MKKSLEFEKLEKALRAAAEEAAKEEDEKLEGKGYTAFVHSFCICLVREGFYDLSELVWDSSAGKNYRDIKARIKRDGIKKVENELKEDRKNV